MDQIAAGLVMNGDHLVEQLMRFRPEGLSANAWALRAGVSRTIWSDLRRHGNPSRRTLEKLLGAAGSSIAEFEALRVGPRRLGVRADAVTFGDRTGLWNGAPMPPLAVLECVEAGAWQGGPLAMWRIDPGREIAQAARPPSLAADGDAFALIVPGTAMAPRFRTGRMIAVSPAMTVTRNEDVLVRLNDGGGASGFIAIPGDLHGSGPNGIALSQPGTGAAQSIPRSAIHSITTIAGELF